MNKVRLDAQVVRDALLHLSGELDLTIGGPSIDPLKQEFSARRSIFFTHSPRDQHRFLTMFDDAKVTECYRREQNIVPQQALTLANSKQALQAATTIAANIRKPSQNSSEESFIRAAFSTILADHPTAEESAACRDALAAWRAMTPNSSDERARANLIHALLNHIDFITVK